MPVLIISVLPHDVMDKDFLQMTMHYKFSSYKQGVRSFGMIWIRISDPRLLGSWKIKWTDESTLDKDSSVHRVYHDPNDLGSLILIWIISKERTQEETLSSCDYGKSYLGTI